MYNDFLQNTLPQLLEDDLAIQRLWIQDDGPPYYARNVRNTFESDVLQSLDRKR